MRVEHELHRRRFSRNLGVGLALAAFVFLILGLTMAKVNLTGLPGYGTSVDSNAEVSE